MEEVSRVSCIRGYKDIHVWDAAIGEVLLHQPRFFFLTISFMAIAPFEAIELHRGPFGSGRPSPSLKYWSSNIIYKNSLNTAIKMAASMHVHDVVTTVALG